MSISNYVADLKTLTPDELAGRSREKTPQEKLCNTFSRLVFDDPRVHQRWQISAEGDAVAAVHLHLKDVGDISEFYIYLYDLNCSFVGEGYMQVLIAEDRIEGPRIEDSPCERFSFRADTCHYYPTSSYSGALLSSEEASAHYGRLRPITDAILAGAGSVVDDCHVCDSAVRTLPLP